VAELRRAASPGAALAALGLAAPAPERLQADLAVLQRAGVVGVPYGSRAYPERLGRLPDAPPLLWVRGDPQALVADCVAMVGARAPSAYGRATAARFAEELARAGLVIVSGLATGIDAVSHEATLRCGGRTLAVQACGPEQVYPPRHGALARRIARSGALVTEFPPGTPPRAPHFPLRNRVISGLATALVVVEARERSGSLVTAGHAAEQDVDVYAVPGPIDAATSAGTNRLLRDGAFAALGPEEVLAGLARHGVVPASRAARPRRTEAAGGIVAALQDEPLTRDELGRRLGRAPDRIAIEVLELELEGRVVEDRDGRLRVVSPARA